MVLGISGKSGSGKDEVGKIIQYLTGLNSVKGDLFWVNITYKDFLKMGYTGDWEIKKCADKLKDCVCLIIGCTREQLEDQDFKSKELGPEWTAYELETTYYPETLDSERYESHIETTLFSSYKDAHEEGERQKNYLTVENPQWGHSSELHYEITEIPLTPRKILQLFGTQGGRMVVHPNIWVNALFSDYKEVGSPLVVRAKGLNPQYPNWIITDVRFPNELVAVKSREGITIRVNRFEQISTNIRVHGTGVPHESETALDNAEFDYVIDNNGTIEELVEKVKEILIKENII